MKGHCVRCLSEVGASPAVSNVSNVYRALLAIHHLTYCLVYCCLVRSRDRGPSLAHWRTSFCHSNAVV